MKNKYSFFKNRNGYTLIEIVVAMPIFLLVIGMVFSISYTIFSNYNFAREEMNMHLDNTNIIQAITMDVSQNVEFTIVSEERFILNGISYNFSNNEVVRINKKGIEYKLAKGNYQYQILEGNVLNIKNIENSKLFDIKVKLDFTHLKKVGEING